MNIVTLRTFDKSDHGTFGIALAKGIKFFSGELPWIDNKPNISCIPEGVFRAEWTYSNRFKRYMYELINVPFRFAIREHSANLMGNALKGYKSQLNGCISFGEKIGSIEGQKALLLSAPAVRRFETLMEKKTFLMEIYR